MTLIHICGTSHYLDLVFTPRQGKSFTEFGSSCIRRKVQILAKNLRGVTTSVNNFMSDQCYTSVFITISFKSPYFVRIKTCHALALVLLIGIKLHSSMKQLFLL